ncbi:hypothetical protein CSKR_103025, partial [Clonorchis sinensis]
YFACHELQLYANLHVGSSKLILKRKTALDNRGHEAKMSKKRNRIAKTALTTHFRFGASWAPSGRSLVSHLIEEFFVMFTVENQTPSDIRQKLTDDLPKSRMKIRRPPPTSSLLQVSQIDRNNSTILAFI